MWADDELRTTPISVDLVLSNPLNQPVNLPHHNFLPVSRKQLRDDKYMSNFKEKTTQHNSLDIKSPKLFTEQESDEIVYSQVENGLITALPAHVREGYGLAKAFRITPIMQPIVQELIYLGVTHDIHKIIRTYHLKTCVFILTKNYRYDENDISGNDRLKWAIAIYTKLRELVILGDAKEFFATERYIFKSWEKYASDRVECEHNEEDYIVALPRFFCCRVRKARLLMVDQILHVLREWQRKHNPKPTALAKALSDAVNKSILNLI